MKSIFLSAIIVAGVMSCSSDSISQSDTSDGNVVINETKVLQQSKTIIQRDKSVLVERILSPMGFERIDVSDNSFGYYLRHLPLKKHGSKVLQYNGGIKEDQGVYIAVVDKAIGKKDLHQCADAVMRLRADFLYDQERFDEIHFDFTNGFQVDYSEWMKGKRIKLSGNKTYWVQRAEASNSKESYWKYMEQIFMFAGTLSLDKELNSVNLMDMKIGDVFIRGGSPGHAIIVVDMVENESGKKKFLLAQSYMPAQEIQILRNPANTNEDPWYDLADFDVLETPEWRFTSYQLKRFD